MGSPLRALIRVTAYLTLTLALMPFQAAVVALRQRWATGIPLFYHRLCCRLLGLDVVIRGTMSQAHPTLFVSNHVSYIDITVLGSLIRGSFVAKEDVGRWPLFGTLAKLQRTVFIARRGAEARRHRDDIVQRLGDGEDLILFPEGTSGDGTHVLPFKSALFSVAGFEFDDGPLCIQPVSIAYTRLDGMPLGRNFRTYFAWYGDMVLLPHFMAWVGLGTVTVEVAFHPAETLAAHGSRKALAQQCHRVVSEGVSQSIAGVRPVAVRRS